MPKEVEITCDSCGNQLTRSSNCEDYRLALLNERVPSGGGAVTAMAVYPAIKRDAYFCGVECLRAWLDKEYPAGQQYHGGKAWAGYSRKQRAAGEEPTYK